MKLLFVHSTKVKEDKSGNLYTDGSYSQEIWNRYLNLSENFCFLARKDSDYYEVQEARNIFNSFDNKKIKFKEIPNMLSSIRNFLSIQNKNKIKNLIKNEVYNSDYLIVRLPSYYGDIAIRSAIRFNKPYLVEVVGCAFDSLWSYDYKGKFLALPSLLIMKKSIKYAPFVLYVTNQYLQKKYPSNGKFINCSDASISNFEDNTLKYRLNKIKNFNKHNKLIIGTIAAVDVKYKGQHFVIKALGKLKKQGITNIEYQLVGGGDSSFLKKIAKKYNVDNQIKLIGSISHDKVFNWLDNIDFYIQPSKTEGLPRGLIEAMSRALPCAGTNVGGIPELIDKDFLINKISITEDICNIIKQLYFKEIMIKQAEINFLQAKNYRAEMLDKKREKFYSEFIK